MNFQRLIDFAFSFCFFFRWVTFEIILLIKFKIIDHFDVFFTKTPMFFLVFFAKVLLLALDQVLNFIQVDFVFCFHFISIAVSRVEHGWTIFRLVSVVVCIFIAFLYLYVFDFKTFLVDFEQLIEIFFILDVLNWLFTQSLIGHRMTILLFLVLRVHLKTQTIIHIFYWFFLTSLFTFFSFILMASITTIVLFLFFLFVFLKTNTFVKDFLFFLMNFLQLLTMLFNILQKLRNDLVIFRFWIYMLTDQLL